MDSALERHFLHIEYFNILQLVKEFSIGNFESLSWLDKYFALNPWTHRAVIDIRLERSLCSHLALIGFKISLLKI